MSINGVLLWIQSKNSYYRPVHLKAEGIAVNWGKGMPNSRKLVTKLESETSELTFQWGQLQQLQIFFPDAWYLKLDWLALKWTTDCHRVVCVRTYVNISFSIAFFCSPFFRFFVLITEMTFYGSQTSFKWLLYTTFRRPPRSKTQWYDEIGTINDVHAPTTDPLGNVFLLRKFAK